MNFTNENARKADEALSRLRQLAEFIQPGMARHQVELVLCRSNGGIQSQPTTIYHELPGAKIEVTYDLQGWPSSAYDQVIEPPRVYATGDGMIPGRQKWLEK